MRNLNFIRPVPKHRDREVRRWMLGTNLLLLCFLIGAGSITISQWRIYHATNHEITALNKKLISYNTVMNTQRTQKSETEKLQEQLHHLEACTNCPKSPLELMSTVQKTLGTMPLESLSINAESFELKGCCTNAKQATMLANRLSDLSMCKHAALISLTSPTSDQLQFVIKGKLI